MNTLKLQWRDWEKGPYGAHDNGNWVTAYRPDMLPVSREVESIDCKVRTKWISDVIEINDMRQLKPGNETREFSDGAAGWREHGASELEVYTWMTHLTDNDEVKTARKFIIVKTAQGMRYLLVEKAWLLGPDGQTIDKVAP